MSSIATRGYKNIDVEDPKGGHWETFVIIQGILKHRNGHFVRPNKVAFKCLNFKKDVDLNVHVRMFNSVVKINVETFK
jgi:hypothetical protein